MGAYAVTQLFLPHAVLLKASTHESHQGTLFQCSLWLQCVSRCNVGTGHLGNLLRSIFCLLCFSDFNGQKNDLEILFNADSGRRETSLCESGDLCKNVYSYVAHDDQTGNCPLAVEV